ncbi:MAG: dipeptidase [Candidatus Acidiferrales bacterium]
MTRMWIVSLCCAFAIVLPLAALTAADKPAISKQAHDLHFRSIVIDTHDDTTQRLLDPSFDLSVRHSDGNIDVPRMREGGLGAIFFSIYIPGTITGPEAVKQALDQIDAVRQTVARDPKDLVLARTAADVRRAHQEGKIAALMGVEGGHMIADDLGVLRIYAALGVRYMTLTHMVNTDWGDSSTDKPAHNGLTDFGKQVVREMNRDGIMVDISHVSDKTFWDALSVSQAPLIASHSSCRALCNAPRNMTDEMIRALAAKGGVIQINYHVGFLSQKFRDADNRQIEDQINAEVAKRCANKIGCDEVEDNTVTREFMAAGKLPRVDWNLIIDHIDHAVKVGGVDHVGLGSDFDGSVIPFGMDDASDLPKITDALLKHGYSEADVQKILGGNTLRVMEAAEATAKKLQGERP